MLNRSAMLAGMLLCVPAEAQQQEQPLKTPACHFANGFAIGCLDGTAHAGLNAAVEFQNYGQDRALAEADFTQATLRRYQCGVIHDAAAAPGRELSVLARYKVATESGWLSVARVGVYSPGRMSIAWIADRYLAACPTIPAQTSK